jgi:hypothetical protein
LGALEILAEDPAWRWYPRLQAAAAALAAAYKATICQVSRAGTLLDVQQVFARDGAEAPGDRTLAGWTWGSGRRLAVQVDGLDDATWDQISVIWSRCVEEVQEVTDAPVYHLHLEDREVLDRILQPRKGLKITATLVGPVGGGQFFSEFLNGWQA